MAKYYTNCYHPDCNGTMRESNRCDTGDDFIQITVTCDKCRRTSTVKVQKGTPGT